VQSSPSNIIQVWLYLIGTPANARKLRARLDGLKSPPLDELFGPEPKQCPLTVMYNAEVSRRAYLDARLRPALDAWDTEYIDINDMRRYCLEIERGKYRGPAFNASSYGLLPIYRVSPAVLSETGASK